MSVVMKADGMVVVTAVALVVQMVEMWVAHLAV